MGQRSTHVKDEERVLGRHDFRGAESRDLRDLLVPPLVAAGRPRDLAAGAPEDEDVLDEGALLDGGVRDRLRRDRLTTAAALVGRDEHARLAVLDAVAERLGGEPGEHDRVHGADARAREEGRDGVPCHGQVHGHGVALLHAPRLEHVRDGAHLAQELGVGDVGALVGLVGLVDDRRLWTPRSVKLLGTSPQGGQRDESLGRDGDREQVAMSGKRALRQEDAFSPGRLCRIRAICRAWERACLGNRATREPTAAGKAGEREGDNMHGPCSDVRRVEARDYRASTAIARLWANASAYIGRKTRSANCAGGARMPGGDGARERKRNYWRWGVGRWGGRRATYLVGVLVCPAVDAVVGRVQTAFGEPYNVAVFETAGTDGVEGAVPVEGLFGHLRRIRESYLGAASGRRELGRTLAHHLSLS